MSDKLEDWVCQDCGIVPDVFEVQDNPEGETDEQVWVYCSDCNIETFIDITPTTKETP